MHEIFMQRCLELAALARGYVSPNPLVGAVVVYNGQIIGEGYHQQYGKAHAEVNAISSVQNKSLLKDSTIYVSLEPCAHFGKTPPCANLIIESGIPKVVMAMQDPFPEVSGKGKAILEQAGIEVLSGILETEARYLNRFFLTYVEKKRPYITLKWATSIDGFIDGFGDKPIAITAAETNVFGHEIRSQYDAILIGFKTAQKDNPTLSVRHVNKPSPKRFVVDLALKLDQGLHIFQDENPIYILNHIKSGTEGKFHYILLNTSLDLCDSIIEALYNLKVSSVLVEGGATTHRIFLDANKWDEILEFTSTIQIGTGTKKALDPQQQYQGQCVYENQTDKVISYLNV